jgi:hypothetical protein
MRSSALLTFALSSATLLPMAAAAQSVDERLSGVWTMVSLEAADANGEMQPVDYSGQISFTADGHVAVQAMNPDPEAPDTPYTSNGYEAYYGRVATDEAAGTFTMTIESALVRDLIGQELERRYKILGEQLILTPVDARRMARRLRAAVTRVGSRDV